MTIDANIEFLASQKATMLKMRGNVAAVRESREKQLADAQAEIREAQARIRAIKMTLVSDGRMPSLEAVRKRVILEEHVERGASVQESLQAKMSGFVDLASGWARLQARKRKAAARDSGKDKQKLTRLESLLVEQETAYGFESFPPEALRLSEINHLPTRDGFDLVFDISASDNIRTISAYLLSLLELAREFEINHPGIVILDEPRQQSMKSMSFRNIIARASSAERHGQQVIFATSEAESDLRDMIGSIPCHYIPVEGHILKRVTTESAPIAP